MRSLRNGETGVAMNSATSNSTTSRRESRFAIGRSFKEDLELETARLAEIATAQANTSRLQRRARRTLAAIAAFVFAGVALVYWQFKANLNLKITLERQHVTLLGDIASAELLRGNLDSALRISIKGVRDYLRLPKGNITPAELSDQLAATISLSHWLNVMSDHESAVISAAFSPDGSHVATASVDKTARIWNAATGTAIAILRGHAAKVISAALSPDGSRVVTGVI